MYSNAFYVLNETKKDEIKSRAKKRMIDREEDAVTAEEEAILAV